MTLTAMHSVSAHARRSFRWDLRIDLPKSKYADMKVWMSPDDQDRRLDPSTPDAQTWSAGLARAITEVLIGQRPLRQLQRWLVPSLYSSLEHLRFTEDPGQRTRRTCYPTTWRACEVSPGVVESAVVVRAPDKTYAVALRLEAFRGRWMTTALEIA